MIGIGIDAVELQRFRDVLVRRPGIIRRVFTNAEVASLETRTDPVPGLAARFAAKEATMKALGVGLGDVGFKEIEIIRLASGAPALSITGRARTRADALNVETFHVSLTHTALAASAVVLADGSR